MAYPNTEAVAQRQPTDVAGVTGAETISPEIIALTQAFLMASPEITLPQAVKAAYFFHNTGQVEGRDSYIGTSGRVTGKVLEGYRGVARDAAERNVGEVQIKEHGVGLVFIGCVPIDTMEPVGRLHLMMEEHFILGL